ncbi:MAG: outer membrane protein assembly factor BamE [Cyclobacteriaceae bacterium]|nr:outer membrane protein assembly factor BamE [Cyclobacteriaceae bacterium]MDX5467775.1 outer membrane protein assembly factor BamE [Cyclobacteriaceae bacterium]
MVLFLVLVTVGWFKFYEPEPKRNLENAKQIRLGMTAEEVIHIMGEPEGKNLVIGSRVEAESKYQYEAPFAFSGGIEISFDEEGKVIHVVNE